MDCEWIGQLHALHDGELAASARARVESHAAGCPACAAELERLRRTARFLKAATIPAMNPISMARLRDRFGAQRTARLAGWLTAAAAAVMLSCGSALFVMQSQPARMNGTANRSATSDDSILVNAVVPGSELATSVESNDPLTLAVSRYDSRDDGRE